MTGNLNRWNILLLALMAVALANVGCASKQTAPNPFEVDAREYDRIYETARLVLRDKGFELDRQDYRFGRIMTHPRGAPTVAEVWHRDNTTLGQALNSTVNDQRRIVTVMLDPAKREGDIDPDTYLLQVKVVIERRQRPATRLSGSTVHSRINNRLKSVPQEWEKRGIKSDYWQPVGQDEQLEQRLLAAIVRESVKTPGLPE